jgi:hypothetical protein
VSSKQQQQGGSGLKIVSDVVDSSYRVFDGIGKFWQRNTLELENHKVTNLVREGLSELKEITTPAKSSLIKSDSTTSSLPNFMVEGRGNRSNKKVTLE